MLHDVVLTKTVEITVRVEAPDQETAMDKAIDRDTVDTYEDEWYDAMAEAGTQTHTVLEVLSDF